MSFGVDIGKHFFLHFGRNYRGRTGCRPWFSAVLLDGGAPGRMDCALVLFKRWQLIIGGLPDKAYPVSPAA